MDERERLAQDILSLQRQNILIEWTTGSGKSLTSLRKVMQGNAKNILIVVPTVVLKQNWSDEIVKWHYDLPDIKYTMICYKSLEKYAGNQFDAAIYDEAHHITDTNAPFIKTIQSKQNILLSATVPAAKRRLIAKTFPQIFTHKVDTMDAIDKDILPEPQLVFVEMELSTKAETEQYIINPKAQQTRYINYFTYRQAKGVYKSNKQYKTVVKCTQNQWNSLISDDIDFLKARHRDVMHKVKCSERLKGLAKMKNNYAHQLLGRLKEKRYIVFCTDIEQTSKLCAHHVHSKNTQKSEVIEAFNKRQINHLSACDMLNEGANLTECQYGIFVDIKASKRISFQRLGKHSNLPLCS